VAKDRDKPKADEPPPPAGGGAGAATDAPPAPAPAAVVRSGTDEAPAFAPRRARVTVPDTHLRPVEVLVPGDAANPEAAAIRLAKEQLGVWAFGAGPVVEWLD
jgi:hypothetical protein